MLRVTGVPEHFNVPWRLAARDGHFHAAGLDIRWKETEEGSGAMLRALDNGDVDAALVLTEAVVAAASRGQDLHVMGTWICTPLVWGVHVFGDGPIRHLDELRGRVFGISRYGSGSHLMAYVAAARRGWPPEELRFEVVGAIQGARDAFAEGRIDAYLWEEITTRPWVRIGEWRCIDTVEAPWPAFVVACGPHGCDRFLEKRRAILDVLRDVVRELRADRERGAVSIAEEAALHPDDVRGWFENVRWAVHDRCDQAALHRAEATLREAGALGDLPVAFDRLTAFADP